MSKNFLKNLVIFFSIFVFSVLYVNNIFAYDLLAEDANSYYKKAYHYQEIGDIDKAIEFYQKSIFLDDSKIEIYNRLGILYEKKSLFKKAEKMYLEIIKRNPLYLPAHNNLAYLYESQGDINKAVTHWRIRAVLGDENDKWTKLTKKKLNQYNSYIGKKEKKIVDDDKSQVSNILKEVSNRIKKSDYYVLKGKEFFKNKEFKKALNQFKKANDINSSDKIRKYIKKVENILKVKEYIKIGESFYINDNYDEAIYHFGQAQKLLPKSSSLKALVKKVKFEDYCDKSDRFFKEKQYDKALFNK